LTDLLHSYPVPGFFSTLPNSSYEVNREAPFISTVSIGLNKSLLDFAKENDPELEKKVDEYINIIKGIRKVGRRVETGSPPSFL
jgi:hypothetical protein